MSELPFASVAIPTWNRADLLADCLRSLRGQEYPPDRFEIVVVDDGSADATADVVRGFAAGPAPEVRYVGLPHGGLNRARNAGLAASRGDPICFVDDEADAPPGWLRAVADGVRRHPEAGCLGGAIRVRFEARPPRICKMESWLREGEQDFGPVEKAVTRVNGGNLIVRRWALDRIGRFNDALSGPGDETEWEDRLTRAAIPIVYLPSAWLWHRRPASILGPLTLLRRRFRQGGGYAAYVRVTGGDLSVGPPLRAIPFYLAHALRRACFGALLEVSWKLGFVWEATRHPGRRA